MNQSSFILFVWLKYMIVKFDWKILPTEPKLIIQVYDIIRFKKGNVETCMHIHIFLSNIVFFKFILG